MSGGDEGNVCPGLEERWANVAFFLLGRSQEVLDACGDQRMPLLLVSPAR